MRRVVRSVILSAGMILLLAPAMSPAALVLPGTLPPRNPQTDQWMERAAVGRTNGDRSEIHACTAGLLEHHPDADWALAQVALNLAWLSGPGGAMETVAARDLGEFGPVSLTDEAWLLLEAVLLDMRNASASSAAKLDELTRVRSALLGIADASVSLADLPEPADRHASAFAVFGAESTDAGELEAPDPKP